MLALLTYLLGRLAAAGVQLWMEERGAEIAERWGGVKAREFTTIVSRHLDPNTGLSEKGIMELARWLWNNSEVADIVLQPSADIVLQSSAEMSRTGYFVAALNSVLEGVKELKRSIVVRGFLHDPDCLVLFEVPGISAVLPFRPFNETSILFNDVMGVRVYLLSDAPSQETFVDLNLEIRRKGKLPNEVLARARKVLKVNEFDIEVAPQKPVTSDFLIDDGTESVTIPDLPTGPAAMVASVAKAIDEQQGPDSLSGAA